MLPAVRGMVRAARECAVTQETRYDRDTNCLTSRGRQVTTLAAPVAHTYDGVVPTTRVPGGRATLTAADGPR